MCANRFVPFYQLPHRAFARLCPADFAGVAELLVFHPVDTVAKRLMSNKDKSAAVSPYDTLSILLSL